jgi:hypothetical protein
MKHILKILMVVPCCIFAPSFSYAGIASTDYVNNKVAVKENILTAGSGITIDRATDPNAPVISASAPDLTGALGGKQDTITATGATNLLTAPAAAGGQPGTKAVADFLQTSGGTMTGAIILAGAPTAALQPATKGYVDAIAAQSAGGLNGTAPSWAALAAEAWDTPHWGDGWEVRNGNGTTVEGIAACLGSNSESTTMSQSNVVGGKPDITACYANCAYACSSCVRYGSNYSCTRAALFAVP